MLYEIKIVHFLSCQSFTGQQYFQITDIEPANVTIGLQREIKSAYFAENKRYNREGSSVC